MTIIRMGMALLVVAVQCQKQLNSVEHSPTTAAANETRIGATELTAMMIGRSIRELKTKRLIVMWGGGHTECRPFH